MLWTQPSWLWQTQPLCFMWHKHILPPKQFSEPTTCCASAFCFTPPPTSATSTCRAGYVPPSPWALLQGAALQLGVQPCLLPDEMPSTPREAARPELRTPLFSVNQKNAPSAACLRTVSILVSILHANKPLGASVPRIQSRISNAPACCFLAASFWRCVWFSHSQQTQ